MDLDVDLLHLQVQGILGRILRPMHGIFPYSTRSQNSSSENRECSNLVLNEEFSNELSAVITNIFEHRDEYPEYGNMYFHLEDNMADQERREFEGGGFKHQDLLEDIFESLGINCFDNEVLIFRDTHFFRIRLKTAQVYVHQTDDPEKSASLCLQPISTGWSNSGLTRFELTLLAKILAINGDALPSDVNSQIKNYVQNKRGGPNLTVNYPRLGLPNEGILGLRDEMLIELERLREIMTGESSEPLPPRVDDQGQIYHINARASIMNELRELFRKERKIRNPSALNAR